jgi:Beta-propeller repeat/FG-GAP-like repeat
MFKKVRLYIALVVLVVGLLSLGLIFSHRSAVPVAETVSDAAKARIMDNFGKLPLSFIENQGQADARIFHYIQSPGRSVYFTKDGHTLSLSKGKGEDAKAHIVKVELVGAAAEQIDGLERGSGIVSYFKGKKENWKTGIPTHSKIGYIQPWPGIDLAYDGSAGRLESIYTVAPHADPGLIKLRYSGQDSLRLDDKGSLVYTTSLGDVKETAPIAWQEINGQRLSVETSFKLLNDNTVAFQIAAYDPALALVIDPTLLYATYIGGSGDEQGSIALDSLGNMYIAGSTESANFPVTVGPGYGGSRDIYVAKLNPAGTEIVYASYIGGSGQDVGGGIAVDSDGNAFVAGATKSTDFPVTEGSLDTDFNGPTDGEDAFFAKVNSTGTALIYASYIGGNGNDSASIAVDSAGNAYLTGYTRSSNFPVTVGSLDTIYNGGTADAYVAKVNPSGTALVYSGYIGGSGLDFPSDIAVDNAGNAYVSGSTDSAEGSFPNGEGFGSFIPPIPGFDQIQNGNRDVFVAKVNPSGSALVYASYIGGTALDEDYGMALDSAGSVYVTGRTRSHDSFPVTIGPDLTFNSPTVPANHPFDAFVVKVNPGGSALVYAGYIGGFDDDRGFGIAVDGAGNAYVTGNTTSTQATFPVIIGPDTTYNSGTNDGTNDAFVAKVNPLGNRLMYAGYIGGSGHDSGLAIAVDGAGNAYVAGGTTSTAGTFPDGDGFGSIPGFDQTQNGNGDIFVVKISLAAPTSFDYDVDGKADLSVFRPSDNTWYLLRGTAGYTAMTFGVSGDLIAPADYDGDAKADMAVFRPSNGTWYIFNSASQSFSTVGWGAAGDMPVPADHDGDAKADLVLFRPSTNTWYTRFANGAFSTTVFGVAGDKPVVGDFDGDGKSDIAVWRPSDGNWYILKTGIGFFVQTWGVAGDIPVPADYDGDGATDVAIWRPSTGQWYRIRSTAGFDVINWGEATDKPVPADYDGDGKADVAVFRPSNGTWYIVGSTAGQIINAFGQNGDLPTQGAFIY